MRLGDYGVLRQIITQLPICFYGAKSTNYGPEMLYFAWLLQPNITDLDLAKGILRSGLVRCTTAGRPYAASIRSGMERTFRTYQKGKHSLVSTDQDVMEYACKIYIDGDDKRRTDGYTASHIPFDASDVLALGLERLADNKIGEFKAEVVRLARASTQQHLLVLRTDDGPVVESNEGDRMYMSNREDDSNSGQE
ncbi:hypothetical protein F4805DRAFT_475182 [Annulohypoxylon moriforme]|nr:hypothetical protein F4805DRAFT_475182 [Annulohypoxylon moriforme]